MRGFIDAARGRERPAPRREDGPGGHRHAWINQQHAAWRQSRRCAQRLADTRHVGGAGVEADRHVGAETERGLLKIACVLGAEPPQLGEAAQHRSRIGRAAAEAGRNRDALVERDSHISGAAKLLRQRRRRPRRQIVARIQGVGERAGHAEAEGFGRRDLQRVASAVKVTRLSNS